MESGKRIADRRKVRFVIEVDTDEDDKVIDHTLRVCAAFIEPMLESNSNKAKVTSAYWDEV